jgi:DNA-binding transcriptional MocR family regulator
MPANRNVVEALGHFPRGEGPLYQQLAAAIQTAIEHGDLLAGTRLLPERTLAAALKLSRTTVVQAYARLREAGTIESRHGSGTWVRRAGKSGWPSPQEHEVSSAFRRNVVFRSLVERSGDAISFVSAQLPPLPEVDVAARAVARRGAVGLGGNEGYFPMGLPALRQAVAAHLSRTGLPTRAEQILVTCGAQQAISLIAGLLVARGEALDLDRLRALLALRPRLLYVVPTYHNPTGAIMPEPTRREVARLASELQVPVVEDNTLAELGLGGTPPPPIAALAPNQDAPILTIGSLDKLFWTGLRVGYIRGPETWIVRLGRFKALSDLGGPLVSQAIAVLLLDHVETAMKARRREVSAKLDLLTKLIGKHLPSWTWKQPAGGLLLWARMPAGDAEELAQIAARHGVALVSGAANSPDHRFADHVRLPIVADAATMKEGIARLVRAAAEYQPRPHATGFDVVV